MARFGSGTFGSGTLGSPQPVTLYKGPAVEARAVTRSGYVPPEDPGTGEPQVGTSPIPGLFADLLAHRRIDGDDANNAILDVFVGALSDVFEDLGQVVYGHPTPARILRDPRIAPLRALPHAALYTGAQLPGRFPDEPDDAYLARARDAAVYPLGVRRGTHEAVRRAIRPLLIGNRSVFIEDDAGGPHDIYVRTLAAETPDPDQVRRALEGDFVSGGVRGAIRAEQQLTYVVGDVVAWTEATVAWQDAQVSWANATLEAVT